MDFQALSTELKYIKTTIGEIKSEVNDMKAVLAKQDVIFEMVNSIRTDTNRIYKSYNEIFNRLRDLEEKKVDRANCNPNSYITRADMILWMSVFGGVLSIIFFILNYIRR